MIRLPLPYPPSLNHYWRHVGPRVLISEAGKLYRERVVWIVRQQRSEPLEGPVSVDLEIKPPDRRPRDLDNIPKAILDALTHARFWIDDSQVDDLRVRRGAPQQGGEVILTVVRQGGQATRRMVLK